MREAKKFKRFLFLAPDSKQSVLYLGLFSLIYGFIVSVLVNGLSFGTGFFFYALLLSLVVFFLPSTAYSVLTFYLMDNFNWKRSYFLSFVNQFLVSLGILLSIFHPSFLLLFMGIIYSINILSVSGIANRGGWVALFYPIIYIFFIFSGLSVFARFTLSWFAIFYVSLLGLVTLLILRFVNYIFQLNADVSVLSLVSAYMNDQPLSLPSTVQVNALLQRLVFSSSEETVIEIPCLHPGPVKSIGGGRLSERLIELRNKEGQGYFWHAPCSHEEDPTDPDTAEKIFQQKCDPDFSNGVSKIILLEREPFRLYGQRTDDFFLVFVDGEGENDFKPGIFHEIKQKYEEKIVFVDTHNHPPFEEDKILHPDEENAEILEEAVNELVDKLKDAELYKMKSNLSVSDENKFMVLVEEVDDEKYLLVTLNSNGISSSLKNRLKKVENNEGSDRVIFLTTDTHHSIHFLVEEDKIDQEEIESKIDETKEGLETTEIGLDESVLKTHVLGKEYHALEASANITIHLFPVLITVIYFLFFLGYFLIT